MRNLKNLISIFAAIAMIAGVFVGCSNDSSGGGKDPTVTTNPDKTVTIKIDDNQKGYISGTSKDCSKGYWENFGDSVSNPAQPVANIVYCVNTDTAGDYKLLVRYVFGGNCDYLRDAYVFINGKKATFTKTTVGGVEKDCGITNAIMFEYTDKSWKNWTDAVVTIPLEVGNNYIRIEAAVNQTRQITIPAGSSNAQSGSVGATITGTVHSIPNIDYITLTSTVANVKLAAGSSDAVAYYSILARPENDTFGTVAVNDNLESATGGSEVTLTATPGSGYKFDCWYGDYTSRENPFKFTITKDANIFAHFIPETYTVSIPAGYASVVDDKGTAYTITGGTGGETIEIGSLADLESNKDKLSDNAPRIIKITARISTKDESEPNKSLSYNLGSNKTLIGEAGKDYGFKNVEIKVTGSNVIVRNLHFGDVIGDDTWGGTGNDALAIKGGKHVWIDHCEFSSHLTPHNIADDTEIAFNPNIFHVDLEGENTTEEIKWAKDFYDGLLDIHELSRFITVSNCYFHDHWKACLCGGSNDKAETQVDGKDVRLTFCNNYFENIHARQPLFRFGKAHIYSSYIKGVSDGSSTGIEVRAESQVYVDNVYFENVRSDRTVGCWNSSSGLGQGSWKVVDCTGASGSSGSVATPPYSWTATSAADSKTNLPTSAGIEK